MQIPGEQETAGEIRGTSRQDEEALLRQTPSIIHDGLENYGRQVADMRAELDDMLNHFHDDNPELINLLENSIILHGWCRSKTLRDYRLIREDVFTG